MKKRTAFIVIGVLIMVDVYALYKARSAINTANEIKSNDSVNAYIAESSKIEEKVILSGNKIISRLDSISFIYYDKNVNEKTHNLNKKITFYFLFRGADCTSCIIQTWQLLKGLRKDNTSTIEDVKSFFYRNNGAKLERFLKYHGLNITPMKFNFNSILKEFNITETPIVIVLESKSKKVLDAYSPIPNNFCSS